MTKKAGGRLFRIGFAAVLAAIVATTGVGFAVSEFVRGLGPPTLGERIDYSPLVVDRQGRLLRPFTTSGGLWRLPASPRDVDRRFLDLLIAYEDRRFYDHPGVDVMALCRAAAQALWNGRVVSGGSTLTMQVARLLEPRPERTLRAKAAEIVRAIQLEQRLSKDQILSLYLALAPYGGNIEGIRAATLAYFGKEPKRLSTAEAALLVALPQSPEVRRPDRRADVAKAARDRVIRRLLAQGAILPDQAEAAYIEASPVGRLAFPMRAAHVAERVARAAPDGAVEVTTIDRPLQETLEALAADRAQAVGGGVSVAILAIDNETAEVRAHVGGIGFFDAERSGQVDLASAFRSPGSTLKPFIYGLAFEDGLAHPETLVEDRPTRFGVYAPENFDDSFHGTVTMRRALQQSLNVPAVEVLKAVGPSRLVARLRNAGAGMVLPRDAAPGLAIGLGGVGLRLTDLATLYVGLARGGEALPLVWRKSERDPTEPARRLFEPATAWQIGDILIGAPPPLNAKAGQIAFKTGTSYGYRDAWAIGFDGAMTVAVWVGRADGASVAGMAGRQSAAPILFDAFQRLGPHRTPLRPAPFGVVFARTNELPVALQRFRPEGLPEVASVGRGDAELSIAWPPDGARIDLSSSGEGVPLALKASGGSPPFTWLVDGVPVVTAERRRQAVWEQPNRGFSRVSVIDARGETATATIRVE
ncbi:MAG: penicillin-binding protein 1C [Labrys sp. (in: a-proteobacteria)]